MANGMKIKATEIRANIARFSAKRANISTFGTYKFLKSSKLKTNKSVKNTDKQALKIISNKLLLTMLNKK